MEAIAGMTFIGFIFSLIFLIWFIIIMTQIASRLNRIILDIQKIRFSVQRLEEKSKIKKEEKGN